MQESNALSLRANARLLVDELNTGAAAALQRGVEIVYGKADVMNTRSTLRHEFRDRRVRVVRLEKLYQWLAGAQADYAGPVGVIQGYLGQSQHVPKKGEATFDSLDRDANMGYSRATRA